MGSPGADGQTCSRDVRTKEATVQDEKANRKILDTLRGSMAVNSDDLVFKRVVAMHFDSYAENDPHWQRAIEHDIAQFKNKGILPPYVVELYDKHLRTPQR